MPRSFGDWVILGALCFFVAVFLMPLYLMVVTGLKDATNVSLSSMWDLPGYLSGGGFTEAWKKLLPSMLNSLFMAVPDALISAILGGVNGYLFSKCKFKGSDLLFIAFAFGMFIPYQSII